MHVTPGNKLSRHAPPRDRTESPAPGLPDSGAQGDCPGPLFANNSQSHQHTAVAPARNSSRRQHTTKSRRKQPCGGSVKGCCVRSHARVPNTTRTRKAQTVDHSQPTPQAFFFFLRCDVNEKKEDNANTHQISIIKTNHTHQLIHICYKPAVTTTAAAAAVTIMLCRNRGRGHRRSRLVLTHNHPSVRPGRRRRCRLQLGLIVPG